VRFTFDVNGELRTVDVERTGGGWVVVTGGRRWQADLRPSGERQSLLLAPAMAPGMVPPESRAAHSYDVGIRWLAADEAEVEVNETVVGVTLARVTAARRASAVHGAQGTDGRVLAPMAGRVLRVLVAVGEAIRAQQALVVVEAMKMESELRALRDGVVRSVHVSAGDAVDAQALLVQLDS
jgi:oxaloacetate decarboxylase alpha subunit